ncbi:MAG: hypothetical protein J4G19_07340, partial [Pseudomonadales bacterium]|nr:hypothetical protein [Pseudomonadales bacterium]
ESHKERKLPLQGSFALIGWLHSKRLLDEFFDRMAAPKKAKILALEISQSGRLIQQFDQLDHESAIDVLDQLGAFHGNTQFETFINALSYVTDVDAEQFQNLRDELRKIKAIGEQGTAYGRMLRLNRIKRLAEIRSAS